MTARLRPEDLVVFLGPSLPAEAARAIAPCRVLPPARAGDVYAVLPERPLAIALVDGLFEAVPSVWHHEFLAAQDAGVQVFGGASMGALRAAELQPFGVVGVGRIFGWYRDGVIDDDGEVALLHAGAGHGWRPFTVPLVDVRHAALAAVAGGHLTGRQGRALVASAAALFYQDRTWHRVIEGAGLPASVARELDAWLPAAPSLKAEDARATVAAAAGFARARRAGAPPPPPPRRPPPPSHARHLRLESARSAGASGPVPSAQVLRALEARPDAGRLAAQGLRRALIAALARSLGLTATAAQVDRAEAAWLASLGLPAARRPDLLMALGLDDGEARRLCEDLALEATLLETADRVLPDGPSWHEGLALAARITGAWVEAVGPEAKHPRPRRRRR